MTTSTSSVEAVLAVFAAVEQRDNDALARVCQPDVEFCRPPSLPYGGTTRGLAGRGGGWAAYWDWLQPTVALRRLDPRVVAAAGQEVVVLWRQRGLTPGRGEPRQPSARPLPGARGQARPRADVLLRPRSSVCLPRQSQPGGTRPCHPDRRTASHRARRMNSPPLAGVLVVIAYDSGSRGNPALRGRTSALATAIIDGARTVEGTHVLGMRLGQREPDWAALDAADAIIFGCPTYMGSGSAQMKAFMEESLHPQFLERRWQDKLAAGFTNSAGMSGDKLCTLQQLAGFAAQHGMIWISLGQLPGWQSGSGSPPISTGLPPSWG